MNEAQLDQVAREYFDIVGNDLDLKYRLKYEKHRVRNQLLLDDILVNSIISAFDALGDVSWYSDDDPEGWQDVLNTGSMFIEFYLDWRGESKFFNKKPWSEATKLEIKYFH